MERRLVIHDGNDYGVPQKTFSLFWDVAQEGQIPEPVAHYLHLFPDNQNSHHLVEFTSGKNFSVEKPSLASLFLWNIRPGFWNETLAKATQTGQTQSVNLIEEVRICC